MSPARFLGDNGIWVSSRDNGTVILTVDGREYEQEIRDFRPPFNRLPHVVVGESIIYLLSRYQAKREFDLTYL